MLHFKLIIKYICIYIIKYIYYINFSNKVFDFIFNVSNTLGMEFVISTQVNRTKISAQNYLQIFHCVVRDES